MPFRKYFFRQSEFLKGLPFAVRFALIGSIGLQLIFGARHLFDIPLHYDEWYSYSFSGNSFWTIISVYPTNNNHILFNVLARICLLTRIDVEIALRLPALFASLLCSWYFFKVCVHYFGPLLSILLLAIEISTYWIVLYTFMARGYSLQHLFAVLCIYSSLSLADNYRRPRYRVLLVTASVLGMLTLPSFIYSLFGIYPVLIIYTAIRQKNDLGLLLQDLFFSIVLVLVCYLPVLMNNDLQPLVEPVGSSEKLSHSDPEAFPKILHYLNLLFGELFGSAHLYIFSVFVSLSILRTLFFSSRSKYFPILAAFMFFSPLLIIFLHRVFPFGRNWVYLVTPALLCLGLVIETFLVLVNRIQNIRQSPVLQYVALLFSFALACYNLTNFSAQHRQAAVWDYEVDFLRKKRLGIKISGIRSIASTNAGFEFYPAALLENIVKVESGKKDITVETLTTKKLSDLLIINDSELNTYRPLLARYQFLYYHSGIWFYVKRDMKMDPG
jgi:hypothetical protein